MCVGGLSVTQPMQSPGGTPRILCALRALKPKIKTLFMRPSQPKHRARERANAAPKRSAGPVPQVREYEAQASSLAESRSQVKQLEGELAEHKAELEVLLGEKNTQWTILEKFKEQVLRETRREKHAEDVGRVQLVGLG